ncbi:MAG: NERD domain-containing protein [Ferruginibacter sp.]
MPVKFHPFNPIDALEKIILKEDGSPLQGEIDVYRQVYRDLGASKEDWDVWHDLKLPEHSDTCNYYKKTSAQIDFLILWKEGVMVLEVKGGFISTRDNKFFYGKYFEDEMRQNPFKQVEGYKHTLKDNILNNIKGCFFCEAVAFPHVNYPFESKLIDKNLLWTNYTAANHSNSMETFIKNVFTCTKLKHKKHFRTYPDLSIKQLEAAKKILSPVISDRNKFTNIDTLNWLGIQNIEILEGLYKNSRMMIEGPPGSGKTTIAKAFIDKQFGKSGIYLCWNNFLMHFTKHLLKSRSNGVEIEVTTFFRFILKHNPDHKYEEIILLNESEFYDLLKQTISKLERANSLKQYDFVVIDEGQDILDRGLDLFINKFCGYNGNGLSNGNALVLYDIDQSYSASGRNVMELADLLTEYFSHFKLNEVKRSAQNPDIRKLSCELWDSSKVLEADNFSVTYPNIPVIVHGSLESVKRHLVQKVLSSIRTETSSLRGEDCIVLIESSLLKGTFKGQPDMNYELTIKDVEELNENNIADTANKLRYTSILKYKGLEKKNVYMVITEPSELNKYEIFVGITRAIYNLEINIVKP